MCTYQRPSESYREEDVLVWFPQEAIPLGKKKKKKKTALRKVNQLEYNPIFLAGACNQKSMCQENELLLIAGVLQS